jgi:DNA repair protein RecN (Recombination protein N)
MRHIARRRQVICITHLPAVAAAAETHFVVAKRVEGGRTVSEITLLDEAGRAVEIARMLGGQTEAARRHAEALLEQWQGADGSAKGPG